MDADRFDDVARSLIARSSRRAAPGLALGAIFTIRGFTDVDARRRKRKCKRPCGACRACRRGKCKPKPNGIACGGTGICQAGACVCPGGSKECQGACIPENQCCGACPQGETCCANVGECKDLLNDPDFCGQCANGQCPGGAICANGDCGLTCTPGVACFTGCSCVPRADPDHANQNVCAGLGGFTCQTATTCSGDADCGFSKVCVSDLCPPFNVCADPCA